VAALALDGLELVLRECGGAGVTLPAFETGYAMGHTFWLPGEYPSGTLTL